MCAQHGVSFRWDSTDTIDSPRPFLVCGDASFLPNDLCIILGGLFMTSKSKLRLKASRNPGETRLLGFVGSRVDNDMGQKNINCERRTHFLACVNFE